jgi:hypothetical protein
LWVGACAGAKGPVVPGCSGAAKGGAWGRRSSELRGRAAAARGAGAARAGAAREGALPGRARREGGRAARAGAARRLQGLPEGDRLYVSVKVDGKHRRQLVAQVAVPTVLRRVPLLAALAAVRGRAARRAPLQLAGRRQRLAAAGAAAAVAVVIPGRGWGGGAGGGVGVRRGRAWGAAGRGAAASVARARAGAPPACPPPCARPRRRSLAERQQQVGRRLHHLDHRQVVDLQDLGGGGWGGARVRRHHGRRVCARCLAASSQARRPPRSGSRLCCQRPRLHPPPPCHPHPRQAAPSAAAPTWVARSLK